MDGAWIKYILLAKDRGRRLLSNNGQTLNVFIYKYVISEENNINNNEIIFQGHFISHANVS